jgi:hypothetical protein
MATLRELLKEAMGLAGVPVSDKDFINNFNRAMDDLQNKYDTAKRIVKRTVDCTDAREEYPLTEGAIGVQRILTSNGYNTTNFTVRDNNLVFDSSGIYFVYEKLPHVHVTSMDDIPTINVAYHYSIAKYIASKLIQKTDPELSKDLMNDYVLETEQMSANLRKNANPSRRIKAPLWR